MTKVCRVSSLWLVLSAFALLSLWAAEPNGEKLPPPRKGEDAFMKVLAKRASSRAFLPTKVFPRELLSDLLWAANGINRPESGKRTAPTAMNWQEIDLYVAMEEGLFLYDPQGHLLVKVKGGDWRAKTGGQPFVAKAPVNLVLVVDEKRMGNLPPEKKAFFGAIDSGFVSQNVYLFCASRGLATVVRAGLDRDKLQEEMGLRAEQRVIVAQSVGFPEE